MKIVLDGNIGCGKSSILSHLLNDTKLNIYNEPLDIWSEWLKLFYSDMPKYAFGFQMRVLKSHMAYKSIMNGIFERSPISCQYVFGQLLFEDNYLNKEEFKLINEFNQDYGWRPDMIIYLKCPPKVCLERIKQRNPEENISLEYLQKIHEKYEELYNDNKLNLKIIMIDGTQDLDTIITQIKNLI
jgi:deoxyadenosine/deoxycytidine kinase